MKRVDLRGWLRFWGWGMQDVCMVNVGAALFRGELVRWDTAAISCRAVLAIGETGKTP